MAEDTVKLLCRPGIPIILVFLTPSAGTQPFQQGRKIHGDVDRNGGSLSVTNKQTNKQTNEQNHSRTHRHSTLHISTD